MEPLNKFAISVIEAMVDELELEIVRLGENGVEKELVVRIRMPKIYAINHNIIHNRDFGETLF